MKKIALLLCLCLLLPACGNSETTSQSSVATTTAITSMTTSEEDLFPNKPDFRNVNWGMSPQLVEKRENDGWAGAPTNKDSSNILYQDVDCAGYKTDMIYQFTKDSKLYTCMYKFKFDDFDSHDIIQTYIGVKAKLDRLYGKHITGEYIYSSDYKNTSLENAFLYNQVTIFFEWETDTTLIQFHVENTLRKKGEITFNLLYRSKEYDPNYTDPATTTTTNGKGSKGL